LSITFSNFASTYDGNNGYLQVYDYLRLSPTMTMVNVNLAVNASSLIKSFGKKFKTTTDNGNVASITLVDNFTTSVLSMATAGGSLILDDNTLVMEQVDGNGSMALALDGVTTLTYEAGAKVTFNIPNGLSEVAFYPPNGLTLPPIEVTGTGDAKLRLFTNPLEAESLLVEGGEIREGSWDIAGSAVAHNATITNCNFTGTALNATDNCVDGGGNVNVNFV
jgi:hypothetical protein